MQFDGDNRMAEPCNNPERGVFIDSPHPPRIGGVYRLKAGLQRDVRVGPLGGGIDLTYAP